MTWKFKHFNDLAPVELYDIMQLRNEVFVVEQNCVYQDADGKDQDCYHLMGYKDGKLDAYTRIVPPGLSYAEPSIGRVVTSPRVRRSGIGRELMTESIRELYRLFGNCSIRIGAQLYLKNFYESLGFRKSSDVYLEDDIEHIEMLRE